METKNLTVALGCDHGGYQLKETLKSFLAEREIAYQDFGCYTQESCDYPIYAAKAAKAVAAGACGLGVVVCTTGVGVSIAANKIPGVRCALCHEPWSAQMARRHNDANVLALGAGVTGPKLAVEILDAFLHMDFEGGRHARRVAQIKELEERE